MTSIKPMTQELAIQTAHQLYMLLYDIKEVDEDIFTKAVAPEIYAAARMENKAAQEIVKEWCDFDCYDELKELRERYVV